MKTKVVVAVIAALFLVLSCTNEQKQELVPSDGVMEFSAVWADESDTKTAIQANGTSVWWTTGEKINVFQGENYSGVFTSTNTEPQATVKFRGSLNPVAGSSGNGDDDSFVAVYPYDNYNSYSGGIVLIRVPEEQTAVSGTFADKLFPAVARSRNRDLEFHHVCGGARFCVSQSGITEVVFTAVDGVLSGDAAVEFDDEGNLNVTSFGSFSVSVKSPDGGFVPGVYYYAAMLPGVCYDGMDIKFIKSDGSSAVYNLTKTVTVHRAVFGKLDNLDRGLKFERPSTQYDIILRDFNSDTERIVASCQTQRLRTRWFDMSYVIIETVLNMSIREFRQQYYWDEKTYVKSGMNPETGLNYYTESTDFGTVHFLEDTTYDPSKDYGSPNDAFQVTITKDQALAILEKGGEHTLYARFRGRDDVYLGLTVHVAGRVALKSIQRKIPNYWFDEIDGYQSTVRMHVLVPNDWNRSGVQNDVTIFISDLDSRWYIPSGGTTNRPEFVTEPENVFEQNEIKYEYVFPKEANQAINVLGYGRKWMWVDESTLAYDGQNVVTLTPDGRLQYLHNAMSKKLLNYVNDSDDPNDILYCKVGIKAYYGDETAGCLDYLGDYVFNVRFIRPVNFNAVSPVLYANSPTGSMIPLGGLLNATDWQGFKIFERDFAVDEGKPKYNTYGMYVPCYFWGDFGQNPDFTNYRIDWYGYYGFRSMSVHVSEAETDLTGERLPLLAISSSILLYVARKDAIDMPYTSDVDIASIDDYSFDRPVITGLNDYVLYYYNSMSPNNDYHIWVPVTVSYAWGDYTQLITIQVRRL